MAVGPSYLAVRCELRPDIADFGRVTQVTTIHEHRYHHRREALGRGEDVLQRGVVVLHRRAIRPAVRLVCPEIYDALAPSPAAELRATFYPFGEVPVECTLDSLVAGLDETATTGCDAPL
jgi:hypothetical protein